MPEEWVTTPFAASASVSEKTALHAPRDLKAPAACRFSLEAQPGAVRGVEPFVREDGGALDERPDALLGGADGGEIEGHAPEVWPQRVTIRHKKEARPFLPANHPNGRERSAVKPNPRQF